MKIIEETAQAVHFSPGVKQVIDAEELNIQRLREIVHHVTEINERRYRRSVLDVNYLGRYASTTLAAFELFLS
ncbi:hypothetical protein [Klebsiella pneumoniae]|uniref:hypothetical protein n=1 Tax=Klebsiella pneumoniae TaxID=573 RepID=UPI00190AD8AD|nr:hypothetical protein [Klebsiella pneumoniae]